MVERIYTKIYRYIDRKKLSCMHFGMLGKNTLIRFGNEFMSPHNIYIEDNVSIGYRNYFYADGSIRIQEGTIISDNCEFRTASHHYDGESLEAVPFDKGKMIETITIEKNCWIGTHVLVLGGVTIHEGV